MRVRIVSKTYRCSRSSASKVVLLAGASEQSQHHGRSQPTIAE